QPQQVLVLLDDRSSDPQTSQRRLQGAEELQSYGAQLGFEVRMDVGLVLPFPEVCLVRTDEHAPTGKASGMQLAAEFEVVLQVDRVLHHSAVRGAGLAMHVVEGTTDAGVVAVQDDGPTEDAACKGG